MTEVGNRYGRLVVTKELLKNGRKYTEVLCDCGKSKEIRLSHLKSGKIQSCKCLQKERIISKVTTHGLRNHPLYIVWSHLRQRCNNPNDPSYIDYGGRGITVCFEWNNSFEIFYAWSMSNGWSKDLQIDRKDNNEGYYPSNCHFVTRSVNCRNRRNNVFVEYKGVSKILSQWAEESNIEIRTLWARIFTYKWDVGKALTTLVKQKL